MPGILTQRRILAQERDPYWTQVRLLLAAGANDGAKVTRDLSQSGQAVTFAGDAVIKTDQSVFGGGSFYFDGSGDWISVPSISLPGDFTAEFWIRWVTRKASALGIAGASAANTQMFATLAPSSDGVNAGRTNSGVVLTGSYAWSNNVWTHMAIVRSSGNWRSYINGQDVTSSATANTFAFSGELRIGGMGRAEDGNSYMDQIRITAAARYVTNFSPPQRPFPRG